MTCTRLGQDVYRKRLQEQRREQLILDHLDLVRHVVGKLVAQLPRGCDVENLESAGMLGLVEAANHYEPHRGIAFSTFAYRRIRGAVVDELRRNCPLPQRVLRQIHQVRKARQQFVGPVTPEQIADAAGLSPEALEETLEAIRLARVQQSGRDTAWIDEVVDRQAPGPAAVAQRRELHAALTDAIEQLPERERHVLILYYLEDLRLKEIGAVVKLSESRVSRLLSRAETRLQGILRSRMEELVPC